VPEFRDHRPSAGRRPDALLGHHRPRPAAGSRTRNVEACFRVDDGERDLRINRVLEPGYVAVS